VAGAGGRAAIDAARVVIVLGTRGLDREARAALAAAVRSGSGLFVVAGPEVEPGVVRELLGEAARAIGDDPGAGTTDGLVASDARHPVLSALGDTAAKLGQIRVERAWMLPEARDGTVLLRYSSGRPALVEWQTGRGRAFLLTTDLTRRWNTWPLHPTFVPFVVETVRYLSGERAVTRERAVESSGPAEMRHPGIVSVPGAGRVAVNVSSAESRIETLPPEEFFGRLERLGPVGPEGGTSPQTADGQTLWRLAIAAAMVVLVLEGLVAARSRGTVAAPADGAGLGSIGEAGGGARS
jgi:hypothetical protein